MNIEEFNSPLFYVLDESGNPKQEPNILKWHECFKDASRRIVARQEVCGVVISTVFLGVDHGWRMDGYPIVWETMVFGGDLDSEQERCGGSREQALAMHDRMVERVKESQKSPDAK